MARLWPCPAPLVVVGVAGFQNHLRDGGVSRRIISRGNQATYDQALAEGDILLSRA